MSDKDVSAILRVEGGTADEGLLDIYDASSTLYGAARAINIVAHSFANQEQVRSRAKTANGVQAFVHSSKKGCFEEQIDIRFSEKTVNRIGPSVLAANFWDYMTWSWAAAVGQDYDPTTPYLQRVIKKDEDFIYVIADALETAMQKLHEPISHDKKVTIFLARPRVGDVLKFNKKTLDFVTVRETEEETFYLEGNVTKYNMLSDFGRLYSDLDEKTVSFRLGKQDDRLRSLAITSMQKRADGEEGTMNFLVSRVISAQGFVKRYIVHDILPLKD